MKVAVFCDVFPELSETFVVNEIQAMRRLGHEVRVVTVGHPRRRHLPADLVGMPITVINDVGPAPKLRALAATSARAPGRLVRDARDRPSWRPEDRPRHSGTVAAIARELARWRADHLHAHFAAQAALEALRVGRLLGRPVSITAHAHDIFRTPANLTRKLREADLVTSGCAYNVRHLRDLAGPAHAARVHEIVMGVDAAAFRRSGPPATGGRVLAIGRLVEKKGFADLIDACARLPAGLLERLTIVGEGPLEDELRAQVARLGLDDRVGLAGSRTPVEIRALLERAAVLAMPCVVADDGDRDSMPVVVKEALAMEVPVVATDEVGLPEIVDDACGRLVPPHDPPVLAEALRALLEMAPDDRGRLGRAGRERVLERCDVDRETARLMELVAAVAGHPS